jgi:hypothetical protein
VPLVAGAASPETVSIEFDQDRIHLFDAKTANALKAA